MFTIDKMSRTPIYEQLISQFESCILSGDIGPDGQLPSIRFLSQTLSVNPNTLQRAYSELERRGLCYTVPGNGRYISKDALEKLSEAASMQMNEFEETLARLKDRGVPYETVERAVRNVYANRIETEGKVITE